jgi:SNF2 family DNA or RNA helicase
MDFSYFHGSIDCAQRKKVVEKFMTDPNCRIFLSTDAGGVGLNLQKANVVVNMDQPWNPAILE